MDHMTLVAEQTLGFVAAQWQDTDHHSDDRTRKYALRASEYAAQAQYLRARTRQAARQFRVGELTAREFIGVVLEHVYGR